MFFLRRYSLHGHVLCSLSVRMQRSLLGEAKKKKKSPETVLFSSVTKLEVKLNQICNRKLAEIKLDQWEKVTLASESQILKATENVSRPPEVT